MSIATEIQRLQSAKANIKSAIENKGVTVGDGTIDTYAELITQITGGGGNLPSNIAAINGNLWTQEETLGDGGSITIQHGLTDTPDLVIISSNIFDVAPSSYNLSYMFFDATTDSKGYSVYYNGNITTRTNANAVSQGITAVDNSKFTITTSSNRRLSTGVTYSWIAVSFAEGVEVDPSYEYNQGFEDGKNSVVSFDRYMLNAKFATLNMFKTPTAEFNFDNYSGTFLNFLVVSTKENANVTVEHLTINVPNYSPTSIQQMICCTTGDGTDKKLKRLTFNINTENTTTFSNAFGRMNALEIIDGQPFNFSSAITGLTNMFTMCYALSEFRVVPNTIKINISLQWCENLSTDTIQSIIDGLADLTGGTAQTLTVHQTVRNKLTDEQLNTISNKNWAISPAEATN